MLTLQFYTREGCTLCESAWAVTKRVQKRLPFHLERVDIDNRTDLISKWGDVIPVISCGNTELARSFIDEKSLHAAVLKLAQKA